MLTRAAVARPVVTVAVVLALAVAGAALALGLRPSAGIDTFVSGSSTEYRATVSQQRLFGADGVQVLVRAPVTTMLEAGQLRRLTELEACLGGRYDRFDAGVQAYTPVAAGTHAAYGPAGGACAELARSHAVQVVYGPATFLNRAVAAINADIKSALRSAGGAAKAAGTKAYKLAIARGLSRARAQLASRQATSLEAQRQLATLEQLASGSGITRSPSIRDAAFLRAIVLGGAGAPAARFQYLFPTRDAALIQVRLRESLSDAQQARAIAEIRRAVALPMFALRSGRYTVTGESVVTDELTGQITGAIGALLIVALVVMAIVLVAVFRPGGRGEGPGGRPRAGGGVWLRLLPLAVALCAVAITFGLLAAVGARLTVASVAVLPVLVGLAVDYAVQFQARVAEARVAAEDRDDGSAAGDGADRPGGSGAGDGADRPGGSGAGDGADRPGGSAAGGGRGAVSVAAAAAAPTLATAALATAVALVALELSPVPMVRGFGLLLVVGIAVALGCALTGGAAVLAIALRRAAAPRGAARVAEKSTYARQIRHSGRVAASLRGVRRLLGRPVAALASSLRGVRALLGRPAAALGSSLRGARDLLRDGARVLALRRAGELPQRAVAAAWRRPALVLAVAAVLAAGGWAVSGATPVQSDVTKLVPQDSRALRDLRTLEHVTGVSGEIDVLVSSPDVATPRTVAWMRSYQSEVLRHFGYRSAAGCAHAALCPALSLTDLFATGLPSGTSRLTSAQIRALLAAVPQYFSRAVLTGDRRAATLTFGIRLMPLARQQRVIDYMRSRLSPPPGVTATLTGLPVLAATADRSLSSVGGRFEMLGAALLLVALVLLVALRSLRRAFVPLVPIVLATGWSALIVFAIGIPLNPMTATLGAVVIAITTEFSVLLSERFRQERAAGSSHRQALQRTYRLTGAAVMTSGITAVAGFAVLAVSRIEMLRQFGIVTLVDLAVSLAGVIVVLPAVLAVSERRRADAHAAGAYVSGPGGPVGSGPGQPDRSVRERVPAG